MKKMKKFLSMLVAATMTLAMAAPSFADTTTNVGTNEKTDGKITINNAIEGQDYTLYKIFDLESFSIKEDTTKENIVGNYSYKIANDSWKGLFQDENYKEYFTLDNDGYLIGNGNMNDDTSRQFAQDALAWAIKYKIKPVDVSAADKIVQRVDADGNIVMDGATADHCRVIFSNLALGYYLVDSTAGALCSLDTTAREATISEKNEVPTVDKKIVKSDETEVSTNSASVGDYIKYKAVITAKPGAQKYVFHDKMSTGLAFVNGTVDNINYSLTVEKKESSEATTKETVGVQNYTILTANDLLNKECKCTFEVKFTDTFVESLKDGNQIIITYYARVTNDAVVRGDGNTNTAKLEYGDNKFTTESTTTTKVYDLPVYKYTATLDADGNEVAGSQMGLADATFTLSKNADGTFPIEVQLVQGEKTTYKVYDPAAKNGLKEEEIKALKLITEITTTTDDDANGKFIIQGLAAGTYYLTETKAPNGYNKLTAAVKVTIGEDGKVYQDVEAITNETKNVTEIAVFNNTGALLPSTGGIGTTIFYAAGIILMAGAVFFVVRRKRA